MNAMGQASHALFAGEMALVTGGAQGIGLAAATALAVAGCSVIVADTDGPLAEKSASAIKSLGHTCTAHHCDVTSWEACLSLASHVEKSFGPLSILVNNAGTSTGARLSDDNFSNELDRVLQLNLHGLLNMCRAFLPQLEITHGNIINVASITALVAGNSAIPYAASKAAVMQATKNLARELGPKGIRANAIAPGLTRTSLALRAFNDHTRIARMEERTALKRLAEPEDIAGPIVFLASSMARYVTGVMLPVDGGYLAS